MCFYNLAVTSTVSIDLVSEVPVVTVPKLLLSIKLHAVQVLSREPELEGSV